MISFRVDDFPFTKSEETWRHNLSNFKMFNDVMRKYHATYTLAVIPDRLTDDMLKFLGEEQYMIDAALHGIHHDERFLNEFHSGETEEQIYQAIMSAKYPLEKYCGQTRTYIPPHNVVDTKTVDALVRAGFKTLYGGPETDPNVMEYAHLQKGMHVLSHFPPHYGRTDEMTARGYIDYVKARPDHDVHIGLHWTWEWNVGLHNLEKFLDGLKHEIGIGRLW